MKRFHVIITENIELARETLKNNKVDIWAFSGNSREEVSEELNRIQEEE